MRRGMLRELSRLGARPMQTSSSAKRTCSDSRSASEYTATVSTPSSLHARITRRAISPRVAARGVRRSRLAAQLLAGADPPQGHLPAVGDQHFLEHYGVSSIANRGEIAL